MKIAFIGTGVMGSSMVLNLIRAGHAVTVSTRTASRAQPLLDAGASWAETPSEASAEAEVIITIVGFPQDVEEVYFGTAGIFTTAPTGASLIDMTTSKPALAQRIAETAKKQHLQALDAPVSGGDKGAREGTLSIMVGGEKTAFDRMLPIFQAMGKTIVYQGPAGSGQFTKMANQIVIASTMMGVCEAMYYAEKSGLDPFTVLQSIGSGAAESWSLTNLMPRALADDYAPGFYVKHFIKDMTIALESADELKINLPGLALAKRLYEILAKEGGEDDGTQALLRLYRESKAKLDS